MMSRPKLNVLGWIGAAVALLGMLGGGGAAILGLANERSDALRTLQDTKTHVEDHENRLRVIERTTDQTAVDVRWIREHLQKHEDS